MQKISLLIIIILLAAAQAVYAGFSISPPILSFKINSGDRVGWVEVVHTDGPPIAVELTILKRILDLEGDIIEDSLLQSNDFTVYPSQILLYPGNKVKAQIVLKSKEKITADKAYLLFAREVPFDFPREELFGKKLDVKVSMKMAYQTIIALESNKPGSLTFVSSKALDSGYVEVIVENRSLGRVHTNYIHIMAGGKKITEFTGKGNSIMPGQKRRFTFKHNKPLTAKDFSWGIN